MGVSQNWGTSSGVPIIRIIVYWGLYWGHLILGNFHILETANSSATPLGEAPHAGRESLKTKPGKGSCLNLSSRLEVWAPNMSYSLNS